MTEASENSYQEAMEAMREALRTSERLELDANRLSCRVRGAFGTVEVLEASSRWRKKRLLPQNKARSYAYIHTLVAFGL